MPDGPIFSKVWHFVHSIRGIHYFLCCTLRVRKEKSIVDRLVDLKWLDKARKRRFDSSSKGMRNGMIVFNTGKVLLSNCRCFPHEIICFWGHLGGPLRPLTQCKTSQLHLVKCSSFDSRITMKSKCYKFHAIISHEYLSQASKDRRHPGQGVMCCFLCCQSASLCPCI